MYAHVYDDHIGIVEQMFDLMNGNTGHVFIVIRSRKTRTAENQQEYNACGSASPDKFVSTQI
jgi:hypothetical protein